MSEKECQKLAFARYLALLNFKIEFKSLNSLITSKPMAPA
jgi:hypothetical protein